MINNMKNRMNRIRHQSVVIAQVRLETDLTDPVKDADKKTINGKTKKVKEFKRKERKSLSSSRI